MTGPTPALSPGGRLLLLGAVAACHAMIFLHWEETPSALATETPMEVTIIAVGEAAIDIPEAVSAPSTTTPPDPAPPESVPAADDPGRADDRPTSPEPSPQPVETPASAIRVETSAKPNQPSQSRPDKRRTERDRKHVTTPPRPSSRHTAEISTDTGDSAASRVSTRMGSDAGHQTSSSSMSRASYAALVVAEFNRRKVYPESARQSHQQGTASLSFAIGASGEVISYKITRSTGSDALDRAIDSMMKTARPPPPPDGLFRGHFVVRFSMND
ncbi:energy transducer TonB [Rhodopseudomonas palustris]|uniref:energy transducer TonB n=2 Tax=Rhodopseudomonas palustris TaxID=1076 RepID=UPI0014023624|nr:TonB family protein [Rhodopseudomonas palustris]